MPNNLEARRCYYCGAKSWEQIQTGVYACQWCGMIASPKAIWPPKNKKTSEKEKR